jgi:hypothetical protein
MIEGATVVKDLEALPSPHTISISIITPPAITVRPDSPPPLSLTNLSRSWT